MKELWKALVARLVYLITPKPPIPPAPIIVEAPELPLKPGTCECGHARCHHIGGKGKCGAAWPPKTTHNDSDEWRYCACHIFILDDDDDGDNDPETPTPSELERLFSK